MRAENENGWQALAAAVVLQALLDLQNKRDAITRTDALLWLASPECDTFCDALGIDVWPKVAQGRYEVKRWLFGGWRPGSRKVKRQETEVEHE